MISDFHAWLEACRKIIRERLRFSHEQAHAMVVGAGIQQYREKYKAGITPDECVDKELIYHNE